ncbi:SDR family oxidoreductase [Rhodopila sp.]|uniref:SDR family oxidoreductase n=1 Tax=Rhodopila sp. TaxID=2480087 RepID=UPI002C5DB176|nr:SDR family oxidoreductase [Rhodopila sp.]HVZ07672.1 SDR family oxidoreductase [Rhodopila sp.]
MRQVMIVTGGSQGIGAAIARLGAARGYAVALTYQSNRALADQVADGIALAGGKALAVRAEMADEDSILALFRTVDEAFGPVTALVNNAGTPGPITPIDGVTAAILDTVLAVNVRAPFLLIREAVKRMATDRGGPGGAIVNVSSRAAGLGGAGEWIHYAASKGALDSLTIGAAKELATRGIRVNAVSPGLIETDLHARAGAPDRVARMTPGVPMARSGSAEEVAHAVLWLLSPDASYVTGANVPVSGGR